MNKFQKSLDRIKKNVPLHEDSWIDEDKEHVITIMEALEKQIPKKPIINDWINCPNCNWGLALLKGTHNCPKCGQALDWSDTE